jgi:hypothetical protein
LDEREAEKARLQALVNAFAKKAVRGCTCTYFKERTAERVPTEYRIDKSLEYLVVVNARDPSGTGTPEVTCPIGRIQDIYSLAEDADSCFPANVVEALDPKERDLLLMVVYRMGDSKNFRFVLLEESRESRDIFLESLRILCIYAQSTPSTMPAG